jgi:hypothetical protein
MTDLESLKTAYFVKTVFEMGGYMPKAAYEARCREWDSADSAERLAIIRASQPNGGLDAGFKSKAGAARVTTIKVAS